MSKEEKAIQAKPPAEHQRIEGVNIIGAEKISDRFLTVLKHILSTLTLDTVWTVAFVESIPLTAKGLELFSGFYCAGKTIEVNLNLHFKNVKDRIFANDCDMEAHTFLWYNLLVSIHHELWHAIKYHNDGIRTYELPEEEQEALCVEAQLWAYHTVHMMAKTVDIDPGELKDCPYLGEKLLELREDFETMPETEDTPPNKLAGIKMQLKLLENGSIYITKKKKVGIQTLREYCQHQVKDGDELWTIPIVTEVIDEEPEPAPLAGGAPKESETAPDTFRLAETQEADYIEDIEDPGDLDESGSEQIRTITPDINDISPIQTPEGAAAKPAQMEVLEDWNKPFTGATTIVGINTANDGTKEATVNSDLPLHNLTAEELTVCAYKVYMRLATFIHNKCEFVPGGEKDYQNEMGILDYVPIHDIPNAEKLFHSMTCLDDTGHLIENVKIWEDDPRLPNKQPGWIRGRTLLDGKLPGYWLYVNAGGKLARRSIIPQDCNKTKTSGELKEWALRARKGHFIVTIMRVLTEAEIATKTVSGIQVKIEADPGKAPVYTINPNDFTNSKVISYP